MVKPKRECCVCASIGRPRGRSSVHGFPIPGLGRIDLACPTSRAELDETISELERFAGTKAGPGWWSPRREGVTPQPERLGSVLRSIGELFLKLCKGDDAFMRAMCAALANEDITEQNLLEIQAALTRWAERIDACPVEVE